MALKNYKPVTPSLRHRIIVQKPKSSIKLDKNLIKIKKKNAGRNNIGRITIRHRGSKSDHKRFLRIIDRARTLGKYSQCKVLDIQYDPNISGFIAVLEPLFNSNVLQGDNRKLENSIKSRFLILAPSNIIKGSIIEGEEYKKLNQFLQPDNSLEQSKLNLINTPGINRSLKDFPIGSYIYNLKPASSNKWEKESGKFARAAGTYCILLKTYNKTLEIGQIEESISVVRLPSKKILNIPSSSLASLGQVSNIDHNLTIKGKAGANRWVGRRPKVGGDAKNPVDHPMGGKTHGSGGRGKPKKTAWGKLAKGQRKKK